MGTPPYPFDILLAFVPVPEAPAETESAETMA
jgi:hypothetical protein